MHLSTGQLLHLSGPHFPHLPNGVKPCKVFETLREIIHIKSLVHAKGTQLTLATNTFMVQRGRGRPMGPCHRVSDPWISDHTAARNRDGPGSRKRLPGSSAVTTSLQSSRTLGWARGQRTVSPGSQLINPLITGLHAPSVSDSGGWRG